MMRFLIRTVIFLGSAALGLWVASLLLDDFSINLTGFVIAVVVFALAQSILSPFIMKMTHRYASAFLGGVGLVSTFVSLLLTTLITDGLSISGVTTWVLATLVVWLVTALATWLLPMWLLKEKVEARKGSKD
jgi:uncharacterized membrane protein YvlD (DUF360 family)